MTNGAQWQSWLMNDYWFGDLPADLQDSLLASMRQLRLTPGKSLFEQGEPPCGLYAMMDGMVRFGEASVQRLDEALAPIRPPCWFGEVSLFDGLPRRHDVFAQGRLLALRVSQPVLEAILAETPGHIRHFARLLGGKLGLAVPPMAQWRELPTLERVAFRLLLLSEGYAPLNHAVRRIAWADIDDPVRVGLRPSALRQAVDTLCERGIVRVDQEVLQVLDVEQLRQTARHRLTWPAPPS